MNIASSVSRHTNRRLCHGNICHVNMGKISLLGQSAKAINSEVVNPYYETALACKSVRRKHHSIPIIMINMTQTSSRNRYRPNPDEEEFRRRMQKTQVEILNAILSPLTERIQLNLRLSTMRMTERTSNLTLNSNSQIKS